MLMSSRPWKERNADAVVPRGSLLMVYAQGQRSVHQLADANIPTAPVPKEPSKNKGTKHREMITAAWLKRYARMIGDQLPFGDSNSETENLLPFGNKKMVYEAYNQSINEDPTKLLNPCSYDEL